jgi:hypothetical protein
MVKIVGSMVCMVCQQPSCMVCMVLAVWLVGTSAARCSMQPQVPQRLPQQPLQVNERMKQLRAASSPPPPAGLLIQLINSRLLTGSIATAALSVVCQQPRNSAQCNLRHITSTACPLQAVPVNAERQLCMRCPQLHTACGAEADIRFGCPTSQLNVALHIS